jgi:signal transduction histidine kinase
MPLVIALVYALAAGVYIVLSGQIAAASATSVADLQRLETWKGLGFVTVSTVIVFFCAWFCSRRARRDLAAAIQREQALVAQQGNVVASAMAASVAHDANNVLVSLIGEVDTLANGSEAKAVQSSVAQLRACVDRLTALNRRLLGMPMELEQVDIAQLVRESIATIRTHGALAGCEIRFDGDELPPLETHPVLVHQIVSNLVLNACEALRGKGLIEVRLASAGDRGERVVLEVHDDGPGVPRERRANLFEGVSSTKPAGLGLGLFSVRACAELLRGTVEVGDSPLGGAMFRVQLPRRLAAASGSGGSANGANGVRRAAPPDS